MRQCPIFIQTVIWNFLNSISCRNGSNIPTSIQAMIEHARQKNGKENNSEIWIFFCLKQTVMNWHQKFSVYVFYSSPMRDSCERGKRKKINKKQIKKEETK